jgi:5-bromo-4-chloroindolyl phosphate hydrolysis protein
MLAPLRFAGQVVLWALDTGLAIAQRVDAWNDRRKANKRAGLTYKDVAHIKAQSEAGTAAARRSAKTVIIPRSKP